MKLDDNPNIEKIISYPGHVHRAKKWIQRYFSVMDIFIEVLDARIPLSSSSFELAKLLPPDKVYKILAKADLAEKGATKRWVSHFQEEGFTCLAIDAKNPREVQNFKKSILRFPLPKKKVRSDRRIMVLGIPNVGKSTLINSLIKRGSAATGDRAGITRGPQWLRMAKGLELLDIPGVVDLKIKGVDKIKKLQIMRYLNAENVDMESQAHFIYDWCLARNKMSYLRQGGIDPAFPFEESVETYCRKKSLLVKGGLPDYERAYERVVFAFRGGNWGRVTLEYPEDIPDVNINITPPDPTTPDRER